MVCPGTDSGRTARRAYRRILRQHSLILQLMWEEQKGQGYVDCVWAMSYAALEHFDRLAGAYPPSQPRLEFWVAQEQDIEAYRCAVQFLLLLNCPAADEALERFNNELRVLLRQCRIEGADAFALAALAENRQLCLDLVARGYDGADLPAFTAKDAPHIVNALQGALANPDGLVAGLPHRFMLYLRETPAV